MPEFTEEVPAALTGQRVDRVVSLIANCSRSAAQSLVADGQVAIDGNVAKKSSQRVAEGELISVESVPSDEPIAPTADSSIELDVVYEDDAVIVVNKPVGLIVHPGHGHPDSTLVNGLLALYPEIADVGELERPGIVHRLDKGTSGLLVVAKSQHGYSDLVRQLSTHEVERIYSALVWGHPEHPHGVIDAPIGRSKRDPLRMTVSMDGRDSRTSYEVNETFRDPIEAASVTCSLETGRTHQIRVHMSSIGHPVIGDITYSGTRQSFDVKRPMLHAARLSFAHPDTGEQVTLESDPPQDFLDARKRLS